MVQVQDGQCGMCSHFGEGDASHETRIVQIRATHEAPETMVERCGLPGHAQYDLWVTPISGCAGFAPADERRFNAETQNSDSRAV